MRATVVESQAVSGGPTNRPNGYTAYVVQCECTFGTHRVRRRFREFRDLHKALLAVSKALPADFPLPRELLEDAVLANLDVKNLAAMAAVSRAARRALRRAQGCAQ